MKPNINFSLDRTCSIETDIEVFPFCSDSLEVQQKHLVVVLEVQEANLD